MFVTIGASHFPFDRLVDWVDAWLRTERGRRVKSLVQHGRSRTSDAARESRAYLGYEEMEATLRVTDVLVCHGGPGTIMLGRQLGLRPIVVPRRAGDECIDDHQVAFARMLATRGDVELAETVERLHHLLDAAVDGRLELTSVAGDGRPAAAVRRFQELVDRLLGHNAMRPNGSASPRAGGRRSGGRARR
jgi:UDP-N-acetylglucosamine transferase subunit ALG13